MNATVPSRRAGNWSKLPAVIAGDHTRLDAMSTWGPGVFDNDAARDHLFELTRALAEQVEQALTTAASQKLHGERGDVLAETLELVLPNVEIIRVLHETLEGGFLPRPETVADWRTRFDLFNEDCSAERQSVIHTTFDRLLRVAGECWEE
jgi:hypothetical protein